MFKFLIMCVSVMVVTGCQSYKPPMPTGKWTAINGGGFIPASTTKYSNSSVGFTTLTEKPVAQAGQGGVNK